MLENDKDYNADDRIRNLIALEEVRKRIGKLEIVGDLNYATRELSIKLNHDLITWQRGGRLLRQELRSLAANKMVPRYFQNPAGITTAYLGAFCDQKMFGAGNYLLSESERTGEFWLRASAATMFDFYKGYSSILGAVQLANMPLPEDIVKEMNDIADSTSEPRVGLTRIFGLLPHRIVSAMLQEDPTQSGFNVIDWQVERFRRGEEIRPWEEPAYVIAGSELAGKQYKQLFPITQKVMRQK